LNSPTGQTGWLIFMLNGSNDANSLKDELFGVSLILLPV